MISFLLPTSSRRARIPALLAPVGLLLVGCGSGGGGGAPPAPTTPLRVALDLVALEITAGRTFQFHVRTEGAGSTGFRWSVEPADGGTITPQGLYTAPMALGTYQVVVTSAGTSGASDRVTVRVVAAPKAIKLEADRARVAAGQPVKLTPEFQDGTGILLPGDLSAVSGNPLTVHPDVSQIYTLRVTNHLGAVDEKACTVEVEPGPGELKDIHAPDLVKVGSHYAAWVERRIGGDLEWSLEGGSFLGDQSRPTTPVVVFTPQPGAAHYRLKVKVAGGVDLKARGPAGPATYEFQGTVEPAQGDEPTIRLDHAVLAAGKPDCHARVESPRDGTVYRWRIEKGAFTGGQDQAEGAAVRFTTGHGRAVVLTCEATDTAGKVTRATAAAILVGRPDPPVLLAGGPVAAGLQTWAYVQHPKGGETYHWRLDTAQGTFTGDRQTHEGPAASFKARAPGPVTLHCKAVNAAGESSAETALVLAASGPLALPPLVVQAPPRVRAGSGPHSATVVGPVPGQTYTWRIVGGVLDGNAGPTVNFQAGPGPTALLTCQVADGTGLNGEGSAEVQVVQKPEAPAVHAPAVVAPGTDHIAMVASGGRPGEHYEWTSANATLQPRNGGDRGLAARFKAGAAPGDYTLDCVAVDALGDRSAAFQFKGRVESPPLPRPPAPPPPPAGGGASAALPAGGGASAALPAGGDASAALPAGGGASAALPAGGDASAALPAGGGASASRPAGGGASAALPAGGGASAALPAGGGASAAAPPPPPAAGGAPPPQPFAFPADVDFGIHYPAMMTVRANIPMDVPPMVKKLFPDGVVYSLDRGALPPGLQIEPGTGHITGAPNLAPGAPRNYPFQIKAAGGGREAFSGPISFHVLPLEALALAYPEGGLAAFKVPVREPIPIQRPLLEHFDPALQIAYRVDGDFPPGLRLGADGSLAGVPRQLGEFKFAVTVRNGFETTTAALDYEVEAGKAPALRYRDLETDTESEIRLDPERENLPLFPDSLFRVDPPGYPLPPDLALVEQGAAGDEDMAGAPPADQGGGAMPGAPPLDQGGGAIPGAPPLDQGGGAIPGAPPLDQGGGAAPPPAPVAAPPRAGQLRGIIRRPGVYKFRVRVTDPFDPVGVLSNPITLKVDPYEGLRAAWEPGIPAVVPAGDPVHLAWTVKGLPTRLALTRNLVATDANLAVETRKGRQDLDVPGVTRRQTFTLTADGRPGPAQAKLTIAARGVDVVAGDPGSAYPSLAYADGGPKEAGWRQLTGLAYHDGALYLSEGRDQTIRKLNLAADGRTLEGLEKVAGVLQGPAAGPNANVMVRLNLPGAVAVADGHLVAFEEGNHALRYWEDKADRLGAAGPGGHVDGQGDYALFGDVVDLAWDPNRHLLVALEKRNPHHEGQEFRAVDLERRRVKTLAYRGHFQGAPVAVTFDAAGNLYVALTQVPGEACIQRLAPPADRWNGEWEAQPVAGDGGRGLQDGPALEDRHKKPAQSRFKDPSGLAVWGDSLLVADTGNKVIRQVELKRGGRVTTLVGNPGGRGLKDSPNPQEAAFLRPTRILQGQDPGTYFILDQSPELPSAIRCLTLPPPGGVAGALPAVTTLGGQSKYSRPDEMPDFDASKVRFRGPTSVAVERNTGLAYVAEPLANRIRAVELIGREAGPDGKEAVPSGRVITFTGEAKAPRPRAVPPATQTLEAAFFDHPTDVGLDGMARLFVLEPKAGRVRMVHRVGDAVQVDTVLQGLAQPPPAPAGQPEPRLRMAVRPSGPDHPLGLALSAYDGAPHPGEPPGWRVRFYQDVGAHLHGGPETVVVTGGAEPRALAVSSDNTVFVVTAHPDLQACLVQGYQWQAHGAAGAAGWVEARTHWFGPGTAVGQAWGFPDIQGMAADSRGNLFLTDLANGLVWEIANDPADHFPVFPIAGQPGVHQFTGPRAQPFGEPLYRPLGIDATGSDDLVITSGDAVIQLTAPGPPNYPYREPAAAPDFKSQEPVALPPQGQGQAAAERPRNLGPMPPAVKGADLAAKRRRRLLKDADAAIAAGNVAGAKQAYQEILDMADTPGDLRQRAQDYIDAHP